MGKRTDQRKRYKFHDFKEIFYAIELQAHYICQVEINILGIGRTVKGMGMVSITIGTMSSDCMVFIY